VIASLSQRLTHACPTCDAHDLHPQYFATLASTAVPAIFKLLKRCALACAPALTWCASLVVAGHPSWRLCGRASGAPGHVLCRPCRTALRLRTLRRLCSRAVLRRARQLPSPGESSVISRLETLRIFLECYNFQPILLPLVATQQPHVLVLHASAAVCTEDSSR
jgi:hypothetical protein